MEWREVSQQEYQESFRRLRQIIELIDRDPRVGWKGFKPKQKLKGSSQNTCKP
ncbi:MAG: hypothetical protein QXJ75_02015 [Candidatus Bathyarchaeia archaeon]